MLLPRKKQRSIRKDYSEIDSYRICAHMMGSVHTVDELAREMRMRFGASAVSVFGRKDSGSMDAMDDETSQIEDVLHLNAPSAGAQAPHGSPNASVFFFCGEHSTCVSVWWGASPAFEESMLADLRAIKGSTSLTKAEALERLAVPRVMLKWHGGRYRATLAPCVAWRCASARRGAPAPACSTASWPMLHELHCRIPRATGNQS